MGKVEAPRRTHTVYWRGSAYPYSTCHAAGGIAQQARRPPAYPAAGGNGIPRLTAAGRGRANGMDAMLHLLSERMRNSSTRLTRSGSLSTSSSGSVSLGSPSSVMSQQHQVACIEEEEKPLKRLAFIRAQGSFWLTWISAAYSTGKALVPLPQGVISALENTMSDLGGSLVSTAAQQSEKVLYALDAKVDSVVNMATGESKESATEVWWESLSQRPPFKYVVTAYQQAHDAVVATPIYTKALELGGETMSRVHDSRLYRSLLPLVGPLTEPAVKRILESPTFQAVKEHLAPMPPPEDVEQPQLQLVAA